MISTAFAIGWWLGARTEKQRVTVIEKDYARKLTENEQVAHALNAAIFINRIYWESDVKSPQERQNRRDSWLIREILYLARAEEFGKEMRADLFLNNAGRAIDLLHVSDYEAFIQKVRGNDPDPSYYAEFLNPQDEEYAKTTDFLRRIFAKRESEPWYPARVWIKAIFDNDADLLRTAYSERLQGTSESWPKRLKDYQQEIQDAWGEASVYDFGFPYSGDDQEGEVEVLWKEEEYRTIKIVREGDAWKLDEF